MINWPDLYFPPINLWILPKMKVDSPCTNECLYDNRYGFCTACGRSMQEVTNWTNYTSVMRSMITKKAADRLSVVKRDH